MHYYARSINFNHFSIWISCLRPCLKVKSDHCKFFLLERTPSSQLRYKELYFNILIWLYNFSIQVYIYISAFFLFNFYWNHYTASKIAKNNEWPPVSFGYLILLATRLNSHLYLSTVGLIEYEDKFTQIQHPFLLLIGSNIFSLYASLHITIFDTSRGLVNPE